MMMWSTPLRSIRRKDSPDLFLGLFDFHGAAPGGYGRGAKPHYQFRFLHHKLIMANQGDATILTPGPDYHWGTKFPIGYVIEGKISWADIAAVAGDEVFNPVNGYRLPLDFSINDADGGGVRQGIMTWSPYNDDTAWQAPLYWLYTWAGDRMYPVVGIEDDIANVTLTYDLAQNYPNPFNPSTAIAYQLAGREDVSLEVFNVLGQKVATLVRQTQSAGKYQVNFDARNLSSGIYFYRLQAGNYVKVHKMILMK